MKLHVYIFTDCKRNTLHLGYTADLGATIALYKEQKALGYNVNTLTTRLVYMEQVYTEKEAILRVSQLHVYTRQQKERLIRSLNPNWNELNSRMLLDYQPGAKFNPNVPNLTSFR